MELKYKVGDKVIINGKDWTVDEIRMKYGRVWVYGINHETHNGTQENLSIETGSLESIMKQDEIK